MLSSSFLLLLLIANYANALPTSFKGFDARIVNGNEVKPHSLPYQAALVVSLPGQLAFCGGSLISRNYVLTAAHCLYDALSVQVILGAHDLRNLTKTTQNYTSSKLIVNPLYKPTNVIGDLGLIKLNQSAIINEYVKPIKLPSYWEMYETFNWQNAMVSGWGKTSDSSVTISPVLFETDDRILPNPICTVFYAFRIEKSQICLSGFNRKSACNGDSGGPLVISDGNDYKQIGIVSFGSILGCASRWPSVYTRTTSYLDWIEKNSDVKILF